MPHKKYFPIANIKLNRNMLKNTFIINHCFGDISLYCLIKGFRKGIKEEERKGGSKTLGKQNQVLHIIKKWIST